MAGVQQTSALVEDGWEWVVGVVLLRLGKNTSTVPFSFSTWLHNFANENIALLYIGERGKKENHYHEYTSGILRSLAHKAQNIGQSAI